MRAIVMLALFGAAAAGAAGFTNAPVPAATPVPHRLDRAAVDSLGARTVRGTCLACHTMHGPATLAPPFAMIAARYRAATPSKADAAARMVRYIRQPMADSSLLPPMAIERFGLMPALPLPDSVLFAAATFVLDAAPAGAADAAGMRHQHR
jgi:hypothetical protein